MLNNWMQSMHIKYEIMLLAVMRHSVVFSTSPLLFSPSLACSHLPQCALLTIFILERVWMENYGFRVYWKKVHSFSYNESALTYNFDYLFVLTLNTKRCVPVFVPIVLNVFVLVEAYFLWIKPHIGFGNEVVTIIHSSFWTALIAYESIYASSQLKSWNYGCIHTFTASMSSLCNSCWYISLLIIFLDFFYIFNPNLWMLISQFVAITKFNPSLYTLGK